MSTALKAELVKTMHLELYVSYITEYLTHHNSLRYASGALIIILATLLLRAFISRYAVEWLKKWAEHTSSIWDEHVIDSLKRPISILVLITGIYMALLYLPLFAAVDALLIKIYRSIVISLVGWGFYQLVGKDSLFSDEFRDRFNIDAILAGFFSKAARIVVIALTIVIVAKEWDYDVNGFIAGLGLGGLAFALAAKDALANIFGGLVIIMEKPFSIGEWISTPSVEGTVESISFRSTRVRAFDQAIITVPNSTLANEPITNYTRMGKRRIKFHLGLMYSTPPAKIQACVDAVKQMLKEHTEIHPETVVVNFEKFSDSSLDIIIYCFTNTTEWTQYMDVRQEVNIRILQILEQLEISIAFPTRSILLESADPCSTPDASKIQD